MGRGWNCEPPKDWNANRLGPDPPATLVEAQKTAFSAVLAACGVPPDLMLPGSAGTGQREAFRRWYSSTAEPLARMVEHELTVKLETPVNLDLTNLYAHDLVGRASALQKLVMAGTPAADALALSGLLSAPADEISV